MVFPSYKAIHCTTHLHRYPQVKRKWLPQTTLRMDSQEAHRRELWTPDEAFWRRSNAFVFLSRNAWSSLCPKSEQQISKKQLTFPDVLTHAWPCLLVRTKWRLWQCGLLSQRSSEKTWVRKPWLLSWWGFQLGEEVGVLAKVLEVGYSWNDCCGQWRLCCEKCWSFQSVCQTLCVAIFGSFKDIQAVQDLSFCGQPCQGEWMCGCILVSWWSETSCYPNWQVMGEGLKPSRNIWIYLVRFFVTSVPAS